MKKIIITRHAKSSWDNIELTDFQRELNERGKLNAPQMGQRLKNINFMPQLILASSAVRTTQTAKLIASEIGYPIENIQLEPKLYECNLANYLHILASLNPEIEKLIIVSHNPTTTQIVNYLTGENFSEIPTCGMSAITLPIEDWKLISGNMGNLKWFDFPKNIESSMFEF